jgi:hypothetical protein
LGEVVVPRVGVTALTVIEPGREGLVVITLDGQDLPLLQEGKDPVGVWTEGPHIPEAKDDLGPSPSNVFQRGLEGEIVVVNTSKNRNASVLFWFTVHSLLLTVLELSTLNSEP